MKGREGGKKDREEGERGRSGGRRGKGEKGGGYTLFQIWQVLGMAQNVF
jgi:hypothetical protein